MLVSGYNLEHDLIVGRS